ncbi:uncharacterized protein KY384_003977 [Bacidia gigantensis]|uniref:uncharacterized protein n=1 Tax=Bacidia gigantensis TaxID=2732470 RepID=UPI001D0412B3|nr:uncharacterized protein KY384_003977 [Bacidia gigantensis]KAG8532336.1 hypothetical protein KY384_003977 [Bacidia gigantensis]
MDRRAIIHLFDRVIEEDNAIIYFEECETLIKIRDSPSSQSYESASPAQILAGWDKVINSGKNIIIIAASNYPWLIDAGMLRRLQRRIMLSLPDEAARIQLIQYFLRPYPNNLKEKHINKLVPITNGRSGHDIQTAIDIAYSTVYTYYEADAKCFSQINDNGEDIWVPSAVGTSTTVFELDNQHKKSRPQDLTLRILERQFKLQGKSSTEAQSQNLQEWNEKMGNSISAFNPSEFFE